MNDHNVPPYPIIESSGTRLVEGNEERPTLSAAER